MSFGNTIERYGLVSRVLHWTMAVAILAMLGLGTWLHWMTPTPSNFWLFGLHKSVGLSLFGLVLIRIAWHIYSPPPAPLGHGTTWQLRLTRFVHKGIYVLLLAIPLSGWAASSATGIDTLLFDRWTVPPIAPPSEILSEVGFALHGVLTKVFLAILLAHIAGALRHGLGANSALRRMGAG